ncbi:MAG: HNH endonuclease [Smithella sp.]
MANQRTDNPSQRTIDSRAFRESHPDFDKQWREKNRDKLRKQSRDFYQRHLEEQRLRCIKKYYHEMTTNKDSVRTRMKKTDAKRLSTERGRLRHYIGNNMRHSILTGSKGGRKWEILVGYSVDQLMNHLEKKFKYGMSWNNYGKWHIDHIIPIAAFNFEKPEDLDFKKCWSLKNLQPLWAKENLSKKDRLSKPHQPSLIFGIPNEAEAA